MVWVWTRWQGSLDLQIKDSVGLLLSEEAEQLALRGYSRLPPCYDTVGVLLVLMLE